TNHFSLLSLHDALPISMFVVTDDVLINGQPLKAGTYSLHTVPGKEEWTIIFNNDAGQWGSFTYDEKKDALRVKTKAQMASDSQRSEEHTSELQSRFDLV